MLLVKRWRRASDLWLPALLLSASFIVLPVFVVGLACSHDAFSHLAKAAEVYFNASGGSPFLAWSPDFYRGYGHPVLAFYSPLVYDLLAAPHWLGVSFAAAFRGLSYLALPVGGIGVYLLARRYLSPPAAFVAGLAYLFAPYLLFDAIQRGALPETMALAVLPYFLAAAGAAAQRRTVRRVVLAALLLAGLILIHNLVPLFAVPLGLLVAVGEGLRAPGTTRQQAAAEVGRSLLTGALAIGLAVLLTVSVWLPAVVEVRQTLTGQATPPADPALSNWPRYYANFIPLAELVRWPAEPGDSQLLNAPVTRTLGLVPAMLAALALLAVLHPAIGRLYAVIALVGLAALAATFLSSEPSRWLWDHLTPLQTVQLPTRFLGPATLGVALLCGLLVELLLARAPSPIWRAAAIVLPAVAIATCGWPWLFPSYCAAPVMDTPAAIALPQPPAHWTYDPVGELVPRWVLALPPADSLTDQYQSGQPVNRLVTPPGQVVQSSWRSRPGDDQYQLQISQTTTVTYQTFYFPGWQARLDGALIPITPSAPEGLITARLPAGDHTLEIQFVRTPLRVVALIVSLAALVLAGALLLRGRAVLAPAPAAQAPLAAAQPVTLGGLTLALLALFFVLLPRFSTPLFGQRLHGEALSGVQHATSVVFEQEVRYLGYQGPSQIRADQPFELVQYWKAEHALGVPYAFAARIVDDQDHGWNAPSARPFDFAAYPGSETWAPDAYVRDAFVMRLLPGTPPGSYWLEVNVYRTDTSLQLVPGPGTATGPDPAWARVGRLEVLPPASSTLPLDAAVDTRRATALGAGLALAGWSLPAGPVMAGGTAHVTLLWQTSQLQPAAGDFGAQLRGADGQDAANFELAPGGADYPPDRWPAAALVRDQLDWRVPSTLSSGVYQLVVRHGSASAVLGSVQVQAPPHLFQAPAYAATVKKDIGFARLAGYTLSANQLRAGDTVSILLVWQSLADTADSYRVFVHLRNASGTPVVQADSEPDNWQRPTSGWVVGEYIEDRHSLALPSDLPAGAYALVVGLYQPATGARLGEVTLTTITVP